MKRRSGGGGYAAVGGNNEAAVPSGAYARRKKIGAVGSVIVAILVSVVAFLPKEKKPKRASDLSEISTGISKDFDADGRFILPGFDGRKPFASFLPGIGGEWGFPMWAFYVNRGQAIAAFGVENKDGPLLEFTPANKAYQVTTSSGFRTIVEIERGSSKTTAQPFFYPVQDEKTVERTMLIGKNELEISETDANTELSTSVLYFTVPGEDFPAMVRRVTFRNLGETEATLSILDGLARLEPFGVNAGMLAAMGRTLEGWMRVYNCEEEAPKKCYEPFFKLSASTADTAQVQMITEGNFVVSYVEGEEELLQIIVDPSSVFDEDTTLSRPVSFETATSRSQMKASKTPCAFAATKQTLAPGAAVTVVSVYGHAKKLLALKSIVPKILSPGFAGGKYAEAVELVERLTSAVDSSTSNALFDAFSKQMLLDNLLRGGYPEFLGSEADPKVYHTFSRIHGDLERDYNNFQIDASYYSQGSGNYRDVNQNRRVDVLMFPRLADFNLRQFLTLKQADGYNPLTVTTAFFVLNGGPEAAVDLADTMTTSEASASILGGLLSLPFRPGQLFKDAQDRGVNFTLAPSKVLDAIAAASSQVFSANYTHEGFWADHWTYDLDQVESFEAIYPDRIETAMWGQKIPFYMSSGTVQPRDFKYVEVTIDGKPAIRQYNAVYDDPDKMGQLFDRIAKPDGFFELALDGSGIISAEHTYVYEVAPIAKLYLLCVTKFSLLDPSGMGLEMESDKPGWNDAMNGLPGLLGSGMAETCETLRLARWLMKTLDAYPNPVVVPTELVDLTDAIDEAQGLEGFEYWDTVATAREAYRRAVRLFFSGVERSIPAAQVVALLAKFETKLEAGIQKSLTYTDGVIMPAYFSHTVLAYNYTGYRSYRGEPFVRAREFEVRVYPLFLEGPVRQLKTYTDGNKITAIYDAVKKSGLYDAPIGQYKICESLEGQSFEMGRMMAFTPGWLENESIWLHMSFKYYLELLRAGLYDQFWLAMETGAPYNMDVDVYGRSPLECGSFIVSSAYPDKSLWGTGFLARLSGSTAEFLSMWTLLMAGSKPFKVSKAKTLELQLKPAIPKKLFKEDKTLSFKFLGDVIVTYHNPHLLDTWVMSAIKIELTAKSSNEVTTLHGARVPSPYAGYVRDLHYSNIDVYYA
ncbi:hypothetical protein CTAYLR_003152 [Chrysophaeum taylorii]|uniref:Uncharacterized protein n=1 Tax=Chrysophaeum taylorii TaxID=2483200 RepID=A0AAD7UNF3_9STRA|nr:hypothetical protein CTAYLR_003152 [Chrysophaeum taylorii]